jgi:hypothetical protein
MSFRFDGCQETKGETILLRNNKFRILLFKYNYDISVNSASDYGLEIRGSIHGRVKKFFFSPQRSDWLWGPHSFLSNSNRGLFPQGA